MRQTSGDTLKRRAHLGVVSNADQVLQAAKDMKIQTCPLDIYALCETLGVTIIEVDLPDNSSGSLKQENGQWICRVNKKHHATRKRFTVAHELGHFLLHKDDRIQFEDVELYRTDHEYSPEDKKMEEEANRFASEILMPEDVFKSAILQGKSLAEIAKEFAVSPIAAEVRAKLLGLKSYDY